MELDLATKTEPRKGRVRKGKDGTRTHWAKRWTRKRRGERRDALGIKSAWLNTVPDTEVA